MSSRTLSRKRRALLARAVLLVGAAVSTMVVASSIATATPSPTTTTYLASNDAPNVTRHACIISNGCGATVTANPVLIVGQQYTVKVAGTVSAWTDWSFKRCGTPEPAPEFGTRGASTPTGDDAQFRFSKTLYSGKCPKMPQKSSSFQIDLGAGWFHPTAVGNPTKPSGDNNAAHDQHPYTFLVTGQGVKPKFRFVDYHPSDNHGQFKIEITVAP